MCCVCVVCVCVCVCVCARALFSLSLSHSLSHLLFLSLFFSLSLTYAQNTQARTLHTNKKIFGKVKDADRAIFNKGNVRRRAELASQQPALAARGPDNFLEFVIRWRVFLLRNVFGIGFLCLSCFGYPVHFVHSCIRTTAKTS